MSLCHGWRCGPMGKREHTHHKNQQIFSMLMLLLHHVLPLYRFRRVAEITSGSNWNVMVWISNLCIKNRHYQECRTHHHHTKTPPHQQQINDEVFEKNTRSEMTFFTLFYMNSNCIGQIQNSSWNSVCASVLARAIRTNNQNVTCCCVATLTILLILIS